MLRIDQLEATMNARHAELQAARRDYYLTRWALAAVILLTVLAFATYAWSACVMLVGMAAIEWLRRAARACVFTALNATNDAARALHHAECAEAEKVYARLQATGVFTRPGARASKWGQA